MSRKVPHGKKFYQVNQLNNGLSYILLISTFLSIFVILADKLNLQLENITIWLSRAIALLSILYFAIDIIQRHLFHRAEFQRKDDLIDNSLNTKISDENSTGYFTNDNYDAGIIKLGVNTFESSFFTKYITLEMLRKKIVYLILIWIGVAFLVTSTPNDISLNILLLALPYSFTVDTVKLYRLNRNAEDVFRGFQIIFSSTKKSTRDFLIINNTINYEKALSQCGSSLDSKIFKKSNSELSEKWEKIKIKHNLN